MSGWNKSHWNRDRVDIPKTLTTYETGYVLFTNDERKIPLCVIWKDAGSNKYHVRGITDEFHHEFEGSSYLKAIEYVEALLENLKGDLKK